MANQSVTDSGLIKAATGEIKRLTSTEMVLSAPDARRVVRDERLKLTSARDAVRAGKCDPEELREQILEAARVRSMWEEV